MLVLLLTESHVLMCMRVCVCLQRLPERIIERAVKGMLPKGRLGRDIRLHLKAYRGAAHPHEAQQPIDITSEISIKPRESKTAEKKAVLKK